MRRILINIALFFVATGLLTTIGVFGLIYTIGLTIITFDRGRFTTYWGNLLYQINMGIDQIGNVMLGEFMNRYLVTQLVHPFGEVDETISYALAKNRGYLNGLGRGVAWVLELIDPGHLDKAVESKERG